MLKKLAAAALLAAALAVPAVPAAAAPITVPTDLNPGDFYRLAFVTEATIDALSTDIATYNAFVTAAANAVPELAALGTSWFAIGSTATDGARDNTGTNPTGGNLGVPIYLLNDTRLANDNEDLWDGTIQNPLRIAPDGDVTGAAFNAWTGTLTDGDVDNLSPLGTPFVTVGLILAVDDDWIRAGRLRPGPVFALYGISAALQVPSAEISEPSTALLSAVGLSALLWLRRRQRRRR